MAMLYNKTYYYFTFFLPFLSSLNILYRFLPLMSDFGIVKYFNSSYTSFISLYVVEVIKKPQKV